MDQTRCQVNTRTTAKQKDGLAITTATRKDPVQYKAGKVKSGMEKAQSTNTDLPGKSTGTLVLKVRQLGTGN